MITITDEITVSEVARSFPASIPVFQEYGIDFCCGGAKRLGEACRDKGVSVGAFLAAVEKAQQSLAPSKAGDWSGTTVTELIDHILSKHHSYLWAELPRLSEMLAKVIAVHGNRHSESLHALDKIYARLKRELEDHMWKEENVLFPLIKRMDQARNGGEGRAPGPSASDIIQVMEFEHASAGNALKQMRQVTADYEAPHDACNTYRALFAGFEVLESDLHEHIHLENNILFPRTLELEG